MMQPTEVAFVSPFKTECWYDQEFVVCPLPICNIIMPKQKFPGGKNPPFQPIVLGENYFAFN